jgi:DNA-binding transcriptional ArsR family regulator
MATNPDSCDLLCLDLPKAERIRAELPAAATIAELAEGAKALGDPTRLALALALRAGGSACVCDLGWILGRDQQLISHHARRLKAAGIAHSRREGKMVMYELTPRGLAILATMTSEVAG